MYRESFTGPLDQPGPYKSPPGVVRRHVNTFINSFFGTLGFWLGVASVYAPGLLVVWYFFPESSVIAWLNKPVGEQPTWHLLVAIVILFRAMKE
jgi:hypothetical protein